MLRGRGKGKEGEKRGGRVLLRPRAGKKKKDHLLLFTKKKEERGAIKQYYSAEKKGSPPFPFQPEGEGGEKFRHRRLPCEKKRGRRGQSRRFTFNVSAQDERKRGLSDPDVRVTRGKRPGKTLLCFA